MSICPVAACLPFFFFFLEEIEKYGEMTVLQKKCTCAFGGFIRVASNIFQCLRRRSVSLYYLLNVSECPSLTARMGRLH